jgi:hypothetical protein
MRDATDAARLENRAFPAQVAVALEHGLAAFLTEH